MKTKLKYFYKYSNLPKDLKLLCKINDAAEKLYFKIKRLNVDKLDISAYYKNNMTTRQHLLQRTLQKYSFILAWTLANSKISLEDFVFIDYGAGYGIMAMLAKQLGVGTVIYNDIQPKYCRDGKLIADELGNTADFYIPGDIDDVIHFLKSNSLSCNGIACYDVIEHIYDIELFFDKLHLLSNDSLNVFMASGANGHNPFVKRQLMKQQIKNEFKGSTYVPGDNEIQTYKAYFEVRKEMIQDFAPGLDPSEIVLLSELTRGKRYDDIEKIVIKYLDNKELPKPPIHPTNTCDPFSGSWDEHLNDTYSLVNILKKAGFKAELKPGYYGNRSNKIITSLFYLGNFTISIFRPVGLALSPYYCIYGKKYYLSKKDL